MECTTRNKQCQISTLDSTGFRKFLKPHFFNKKALPGKRATAVCVWRLVFAISTLFDAPLGGTPGRISGWKLPRKNYRDGATARWKLYDTSFNRFWDIGDLKAENHQFCLLRPWNPGQGSLRVIDSGTNGKRVYTFLLVINSNFSSILHRFGDMAA